MSQKAGWRESPLLETNFNDDELRDSVREGISTSIENLHIESLSIYLQDSDTLDVEATQEVVQRVNVDRLDPSHLTLGRLDERVGEGIIGEVDPTRSTFSSHGNWKRFRHPNPATRSLSSSNVELTGSSEIMRDLGKAALNRNADWPVLAPTSMIVPTGRPVRMMSSTSEMPWWGRSNDITPPVSGDPMEQVLHALLDPVLVAPRLGSSLGRVRAFWWIRGLREIVHVWDCRGLIGARPSTHRSALKRVWQSGPGTVETRNCLRFPLAALPWLARS